MAKAIEAEESTGTVNVHNKVAIPTFVGAVVSLVMIIGGKYGLDLGGTDALLTVVVMGLVGWLTPPGGVV